MSAKSKRLSKPKKIYVKVSIPRLITDNPMVEFLSKDGTFHQKVPLNSNIVRLLAGSYEAYFLLVMSTLRIESMNKVSYEEFMKDGKITPNTEVSDGEKELDCGSGKESGSPT
jgi:hypothetical protein